ncbi:MFS transporter [Maridesulfovibrio sp.]|uniref:MFS transporter n=1 Tax=Maridesulfovibrio sp. TaxID=2795000 RepID=UPI002A18C64B|nr:MFS transporter [Maridesulfovibrio sp.]
MGNSSEQLSAEEIKSAGNTRSNLENSDLKSVLERQTRNRKLLMVLAFFALSLNLRAPITSLPPIIQELRTVFQINAGVAGFLTSIPVLCFGLLTPIAGFLMKNVRLESTVFFTLAGIAVGAVVRASGGLGAAIAGTVLIGISLTVGNISGLMILAREFPQRLSFFTGLYVSGMSWGSMGTMSLTAPMAQAMGWRTALAAPALLALAAIFLWMGVLFFDKRKTNTLEQLHMQDKSKAETIANSEPKTKPARSSSVNRRPLVWILSVAFAAHTFMFYGFTAWMPVYLKQSLQMSEATAGVASSLFQILGLLGCFGLPFLVSTKRFSPRALFLVVTMSWLAMVIGFAIIPSLWIIWVIFGGISSGGGFTVIFSMIMNSAKNLDENRSMSTVVQTAGYIIASISPFALGHLHEISGNWQSSMEMLFAASVVMICCGLVATSAKCSS